MKGLKVNINMVNCALLAVILVLVVVCYVQNRNVENILVTVKEQA
jgi:hypothetical protein